MKKALLFLCMLQLSYVASGQHADSLQTPGFVSGVITATNNGISLLPNFSLNKPAALFDLSIGKGRLSFDPMFRFGMDGKPWAFIFWWRYKLVNRSRFNMSLGAHPSVVFRTVATTVNGVVSENLTAQRYVAWEIAPTWVLGKKASIGLYYLGSHGLTKDLIQLTTFLTLRSTLSNLDLSKQFKLTLMPQLYYLKMDKIDGIYVNATMILSKKHFPLALTSIVSQAIDTEVAGKKFVWNIGLNYAFYQKYVKQ